MLRKPPRIKRHAVTTYITEALEAAYPNQTMFIAVAHIKSPKPRTICVAPACQHSRTLAIAEARAMFEKISDRFGLLELQLVPGAFEKIS